MDKFNIILYKQGTCWYAKTSDSVFPLMGMGYDDDDSIAIMEALKALGRSIISNKLTRKKLIDTKKYLNE